MCRLVQVATLDPRKGVLQGKDRLFAARAFFEVAMPSPTLAWPSLLFVCITCLTGLRSCDVARSQYRLKSDECCGDCTVQALQLQKDKKVQLAQAKPHGPITVTPAQRWDTRRSVQLSGSQSTAMPDSESQL